MLHTANGPARAAKPRPASTVGPLVSPSLLSSFAVSQMIAKQLDVVRDLAAVLDRQEDVAVGGGRHGGVDDVGLQGLTEADRRGLEDAAAGQARRQAVPKTRAGRTPKSKAGASSSWEARRYNANATKSPMR